MNASEIFERSDELGDALDDYAIESCVSYEDITRNGVKGTIYTFANGDILTVSETGYIGLEQKL